MRKTRPIPDTNSAIDSPAAWFAVLEAAKTKDDYALAARAVAELARLGVTVRFRRRARGVEVRDAR